MISRAKLASFSFGGNLRAGDHICQFFRSADELGEVLVPYFKAGLERNECCLWITSGPYGCDRATSEMRTAVPDFDRKVAAGRIQILGHDEWYTRQGTLNAAEIIEGWLSRKDHALVSGYAGLRISGNTSFLSKNAWDDFQAYERSINLAFKGQPIIALCSYSVTACSAANVLDVM